MSIPYPKLQRMFDNDSKLMLETLRRLVARVEPGELDGGDLERASRAAHSIKSEAGFLSEDGIATVAHRLEDALLAVRDADGQISRTDAMDLRDGYAALELAIKAYQRNRPSVDVSSTAEEDTAQSDHSARPDANGVIDGVASTGAATAANAPPATQVTVADPAGPGGAERRDEASRMTRAEQGMIREAGQRGERLFRVVLALNGTELGYARAFLVVNNLELSCAVIRTDPPLDTLAQTGSDRITAIVTTASDEDVIRRAVHVDEVELVELSEIGIRDVSDGGDADAASGPGRISAEETALLASEIGALATGLSAVHPADAAAIADAHRRVRDFAQALESRVGQDARVEFTDSLRELRDRSIRYARRHGKYVRISVGGSGALVSPAVGNTLLEALLHLIRNSIDHGIESLEERARKGRHPAATIGIRVDAIGERIRVVIQDDGTGIDETAVRRDGEEGDLIDILARSGMSTRESADVRSGRGMGLTTVVHSVRNLLGGQLELRNNPGRGATFVVVVPASSRVTRVLIVRTGRSLAAVPMATVLDRHSLDRKRVRKDSFGALYYDVAGEPVPLTLLNGSSPSERRVTDDLICLLTRGAGVQRVIVVDSVDGEESVVRDAARPSVIHSRVLGREIDYVYPGPLYS